MAVSDTTFPLRGEIPGGKKIVLQVWSRNHCIGSSVPAEIVAVLVAFLHHDHPIDFHGKAGCLN